MILFEVCQYLRNWFDRDQGKFQGKFMIEDGMIISSHDGDMGLQDGQYFRIIGSVFNDGIHQYSDSLSLKDEVFYGTVWLMAIPPDFIALVDEIDKWQAKYGDVESVAMSPYNSESFGGYSYSKSGGGSSSGNTDGNGGWKSVFGSRLNPWRKL